MSGLSKLKNAQCGSYKSLIFDNYNIVINLINFFFISIQQNVTTDEINNVRRIDERRHPRSL